MPHFDPILADGGGIGTLIFVIIGIVGWISNQVSQAQQGQKKRPGNRKRRDQQVQQELDDFLREAGGERGGQRRPPRAEPEVLEVDEIEVISKPKQRPRPQSQPRKLTQPSPTPQPERLSSFGSSSPLPSQLTLSAPLTLGSGVTSHVQQHMQARVGNQVNEDLPHSVNQSVTEHLGAFAPVGRMGGEQSASVAALLDALYTPASIRTAIVMSEIFAAPVSRRKK